MKYSIFEPPPPPPDAGACGAHSLSDALQVRTSPLEGALVFVSTSDKSFIAEAPPPETVDATKFEPSHFRY